MDPIRMYEYLEQTRRRLLDLTRPLGPEKYLQEFPIGLGSLGRIFTHLLISEWYYLERMERREVPPYREWRIQYENPISLVELEAEWAPQAERARLLIRSTRDWSEGLAYHITLDDGRRQHVKATMGDFMTQLVLHESYHRAQISNILRHRGVSAEGLDYNDMMFDRRDI